MKPWGKTLTRTDEAKKAIGFHFESSKPCPKCKSKKFYTNNSARCVQCNRAMQKKHRGLKNG